MLPSGLIGQSVERRITNPEVVRSIFAKFLRLERTPISLLSRMLTVEISQDHFCILKYTAQLILWFIIKDGAY